MKKIISAAIVLVILAGCSCKQERTFCEEFNLRSEVKNVITAYIEEHPQFNTFFLKSTQGLERNEGTATQQGFLLGPIYESLIKKRNPIFYFDVLNKRVFYASPLDELVQKEKSKWIIQNEPDSIELSNGWIIKNSLELFIYRSIYFYYNELGSLEVNLRPDTIFAPRDLGSSIQFENNGLPN